MATRFFLPQTGAAAVNPAFGAWTSSAGMNRIAAVRTKINSTLTTRVCAENAGANANVGARQYVSEPLSGGGTTSGTVKGILRCLTALIANDAEAQCLIRIVSNDGGTFRTPDVIAFDNAALSNEFALALTNRGFPRGLDAETVGSVTWQDGDRIVIEVGALMHVGGEGSSSLDLGDPTGSDLAEDETSTAALAPWIEFSQDFTFGAGAAPVFARPGRPPPAQSKKLRSMFRRNTAYGYTEEVVAAPTRPITLTTLGVGP